LENYWIYNKTDEILTWHLKKLLKNTGNE